MFQNEMHADNGELNDRQKIKIVTTLSEFVWLNNTFKPCQAKLLNKTNTKSSCNKQKREANDNIITKYNYKFTPRDPFNQLSKEILYNNEKEYLQKMDQSASKSSSRMLDDFGSLFYQGDQSNLNIKQISSGQYVIEINNDDNNNESNNDFFRLSNQNNSFDNPNDDTEDPFYSGNIDNDVNDREDNGEYNLRCNKSKQHFLNSNKVMNKNRRIATVINENINRKSESQAVWKSHLFENTENYENNPEQTCSPDGNRLTKMPSMETIKRSLSQINFDGTKQINHKRFLSKASLNISRVNSSSYYNKRLGRGNQKTITKVSNPTKLMKKRNYGKPYTTQHKSTKVAEVPGVYQKSRLQQNLDRVRSSGIQPVDSEIIYKYTINKNFEADRDQHNRI